MKQEEINGFTDDEVIDLYRFVCLYEQGGFKYFNTLEDVYLSHPSLEHILPSCLGYLELQQTGLKEIQKVDLRVLKNKICFNKSENKDKALSFLAHLRNSIAHGLVFKENQQVIITDYSITKPTSFSARGIMDYDLFMKLINIINNNLNEL